MTEKHDILLNTLWTKLSNAMEQIFQLQPMTRDEYMKYYNDIQNYFNSSERSEAMLRLAAENLKKAKQLEQKKMEAKQSDQKKMEANQPDQKKIEADEMKVDTNIPGGDLYFRLKDFLTERLQEIVQNGDNLEGEPFLTFYAKAWEKYQVLSKTINGLFSSMNSNWLIYQRKNGVNYVYEVFTMAMHIWQDIFFKGTNHLLTQTCLKLINEKRHGRLIDVLLIRQVVQSYVHAGFTEDERKSKTNQLPTLATYNNYFEKQFLEETEQFYHVKAADLSENNSTNAYIKKITEYFEEEEDFARKCLHPTTLEKLMPILEDILIRNKLDDMYIEAQRLLDNEKVEDLNILHKLIDRLTGANKPIQDDLEKRIIKAGVDAINGTKTTANKDPKNYVDVIVQVYEKFLKMIDEGFCSDPGFMASLNKACGKFINNNAVTQEAGKSSKSAELLARYCDTLLRKGNKIADSDVEVKINQIMVVFNYIEDKDVFQKFYGKTLAKRLVGQLSASDDYEEMMISKLKAICGFEYASKLQRMFQDIRLSTNLVEEFKTHCQTKKLKNIVDFSVMVLTSNSWPFTAAPTFNLSIELQETYNSFTQFYSKQFNGRKLEWLYQHSKGELQTLYSKPKYTFQVSTYQMAILLLFNHADSMTVEMMLDTTQIENELFKQVLLSLLKTKVLKSSNVDSNAITDDYKESNITRDHTISVNDGFKSPRIKINLNQPIKSIEQKDSEADNRSVDEDRKFVIQAAIVRVMKARKELRYALLIDEVIPQLTSRFKPQIPVIKKCIDMLIEKEYLERDKKERDLFRYLA